jgi:hypothetical protein
MICRCRLLSSTTSKSTSPSVPMPAAVRYNASGDPSPPVPDAQHFGGLQLALALHPHLGQDQVPRIPRHLRIGKFRQRNRLLICSATASRLAAPPPQCWE